MTHSFRNLQKTALCAQTLFASSAWFFCLILLFRRKLLNLPNREQYGWSEISFSATRVHDMRGLLGELVSDEYRFVHFPSQKGW